MDADRVRTNPGLGVAATSVMIIANDAEAPTAYLAKQKARKQMRGPRTSVCEQTFSGAQAVLNRCPQVVVNDTEIL